jgi:hypothetical protein
MGRSFVLLLSLISGVVADTCSTVAQAYQSIEVAYPSSSSYKQSQSDYWNKASQYTTPTCILFPRTAQDVSKIIDILGTNIERFAIKGGGHMPNIQFNEYATSKNRDN